MKHKLPLILVLVLLLVVSSVGIVAFGATTDEIEEYPGTSYASYESNANEYADVQWFYANVGSNAKGSHKVTDGVVEITPAEGKGKMADSEEGFCFYYTKVDATKENFYLKATFTVTNWKSDNQNGFGLICTDVVGTQNTGRYMNYVAAGCYKTSGSSYNIPAARTVWGYVNPNGESPSEDAAGSGDSLRQYSASALSVADDGHSPATEGATYTFALRKSNTGYHSMLFSSPEGNGFAEKLYYGPQKLLAQDGDNPDYVYVGFFASRNVSVSVSDVFLTTPESATDERKYEEPPKLIPLQLSVLSAEYRTGSDYTYQVRANTAGTLEVVDGKRNEFVKDVHLEADELFTKQLQLPETGTVSLTTRFSPDNKYISGGYQTTVIYQHQLPDGDKIYADPFVREGEGDGSKKDPVNLSYALSYAQPGQTIILKDGVYKPINKITIPRGVNGTDEHPITLRAESVGGVTFDFSEVKNCKNEALLVAGNYWHIYGINVINTPNKSVDSQGVATPWSIKGIRVSGSHNLVERCTTYNNSNTGIQISGNSSESYSCWPAYNTIRNCDSYLNCDPTRQDADGFAVKLTVGDGNRLEGCIAYNNIDDGYDLYAKSTTGRIGAVVIENCVAYNNGYLTVDDLSNPDLTGEGNGFKLGGESLPGKHQLINSIAFGNGAKGITSNSCPDVIIKNCTVYNNNVYSTKQQGVNSENVSLYAKRSGQTTEFVVEGLISIMSGYSAKQDKFALTNQDDIASVDNYIWNGENCTNGTDVLTAEDLFKSTNIDNVKITRNKQGEIDMNGLLELKKSAPKNSGARIECSNNTWVWIVVPSSAVAVGGIVVAIMLIRKRTIGI